MMPASQRPVERRYCDIDEWSRISGMRRRSIYERMGSGELKAKKLGKKVLIDVQVGLAFLASLPDAEIKSP